MKTIYNNDGIIIREELVECGMYKIYIRDNGRQRKLTEFGDIISALFCLIEMYRWAVDTRSFEEQKKWIEERSI